MAKEAYYFSHDANARHDDRILELRSEFGWEGYGLYWAIVETLRDCSNYSYPSNARAGLALSLSIDKSKLEHFLNTAISLGLFIEKEGAIYSESLMRRMEDVDAKRRLRAEAGRKGGIAKAKLKHSSGKSLAKPSKEKKEKESKTEYTTSVFLTDSEYGTLVEKHGKEKTDWMLAKLSNHKLASGKSYKSDYGAINSWVVDAADKGYRSKLLPAYSSGAIQNGPLQGMIM
ncbi:Lin1244/Lin1753 domain-containing protein [Nibribacter koreensis]|uniref:Lin1244/Lin1753-like N-terminal domain-containing protein n=1 Tax=Nibribacter koreensis TaxID=1084519 RepID=A0ABP8FBE4_9BACT